jgi:predicted NUDIX family NTP pyrophosphohydrolase
MALKRSAGILLYRRVVGRTEFLLVHPGGPLWRKKDLGAWFIPKGELEGDEEPLAAARREFREELGSDAPPGEALALGSVKNKSGKLIWAWALEGELDLTTVKSNTFSLEWPPRSGQICNFPEIDRAQFYSLGEARTKLHAAELPLLERLVCLAQLGAVGSGADGRHGP